MHLATLVNVISSLAPRGDSDDAPDPIPIDAFIPYRKQKRERDIVAEAADGLEALRGV